MTTQQNDEEPEVTETEGEDTETGRIHSISDLNAKVDAIIEKIGSLGRGGSAGPRQTKADQSADVAEQVKSEVGKLKAAEDAERRRQGLRGEIDALKDQVKKLSETAPVEYRKITNWMWGER